VAEPITYYWGTGRRKKAVARVRLCKGAGTIRINKRDIKEYFVRSRDRLDLSSPLHATETRDRYDIFCNVRGGGFGGQAEAVKLGIARALVKAQPDLEEKLRKDRYLTRDARVKERKKYGRKKARKSFQFSKR
jgi:small subunit ribosomal protein S9